MLKCNLILTDKPFNNITTISLNIHLLNVNSFKITNLKKKNFLKQQRVKANDLAYVCFTSGTTGTPKAVCVEQKNVMSFVRNATEQLNLNFASRIAHSVNCAFDVSVFNIFGALLNGGCLIQIDKKLTFIEFIKSAANLQKKRLLFSHLFLNSAIFNSIEASELKSLCDLTNHLIVGGETPFSESLEQCLLNGLKVTQIYGPTETTVWSMFHHLNTKQYNGSIIGKHLF